MTNPGGDAALAASLAEAAGSLLLDLRATSGLTGKDLGALGDRESNRLLVAELSLARPDDGLLSEEEVDSPERLLADRVWIVDPLDGTREYGMDDRTDWAVHVALWELGRGITAAAVAQPAFDAVYTTAAPLPVPDAPRVVLVSDSRPPAFAAAAADAIGATVRPMGSAGAKAMAVVRGEALAYVHAGGQWEWDSAAPVGVALAHGLHASRIDGSELTYNAEHPYLPDLVICRPEVAPALLDAIGVSVAGGGGA